MTSPRFARLAAKLMARAEAPPAQGPAADERESAIAVVSTALTRRRRRLAVRRGLRIAMAALVPLAIGGFGYSFFAGTDDVGERSEPAPAATRIVVTAHPVGDGVSLRRAGVRTALGATREIARGSVIVTDAESEAALTISSGTWLSVGRGSRFAVIEDGSVQRFSLDEGSVDARVARLRRGERFIIGTPDAAVEVHGTDFRVEVLTEGRTCSGSRTRVAVHEGVVSVDEHGRHHRLSPGDLWPADCGAMQTASPASRSAPAETAATSTSPSEAAAPLSRARPARPGLADENDAFERAVGLRRSGHHQQALLAFEQFLARFPHGPLSESAAIERMHLLADADPSRSAAAARAYLRAYPDGSAREDARRLAGEE